MYEGDRKECPGAEPSRAQHGPDTPTACTPEPSRTPPCGASSSVLAAPLRWLPLPGTLQSVPPCHPRHDLGALKLLLL